LNHEGNEVIGYHEFLPDLYVIYIDEHKKEALFASLKELSQRIWIISSAILLFSALLDYFLISRFTKPIRKLTQTTQRLLRANTVYAQPSTHPMKLACSASTSTEWSIL